MISLTRSILDIDQPEPRAQKTDDGYESTSNSDQTQSSSIDGFRSQKGFFSPTRQDTQVATAISTWAVDPEFFF